MFLGVEDDFEGELPTEEGGGEGESVKYKYTTYDQQQPSVYMGDKKKGGDGKEIDEYASNVHVCSLVFIMMIFVFGHDILLLLTPTFLFAIFIHLYMVHQVYEYNENQVYEDNDFEQFSVDDFDDEEVSKKREQALLSMKREGSHDSKSNLDSDNDYKFGQHKSSTRGEQLPSTLSDESSSSAIKRLHEIKNSSSGLRGRSQDAVAFISEANEIVKSKFNKLFAFLNGEEDEDVDPKAILGDIVSESNALSQLQNEKGGGGGHGLDLSTLNGMDVDIPREQVSNMFNMIQEKINVDFKALAKSTTDLLERALVEIPILDKTSGKGRRLEEDEDRGQFKDTFNFNPGGSSSPRFNPRTGTNQQIRAIMREAYSEGRMRLHRRLKHKKHASKNNQAGRRRRHLEESGTCPTPCDINDMLCNCQRLYKCASEISPYDLSVLYLKGFIEEDGNVTVSVDAFDSIVPLKVHRIKTMVSAWDSEVSEIYPMNMSPPTCSLSECAHFLIII